MRMKDRHAPELRESAFHVNQVWNFSNELSFKVWERERRFISSNEIDGYTKGATKEGLPLHSQTVQAVSQELVARRIQHKKVKLRWRVSKGSRRSLGWIPFKASALRYRNGQVFLSGFDKPLSLWESYDLSKYELGSGNISEDARGRWYLNVTVKLKKTPKASLGAVEKSVGIDLNLKEFAALSDGYVVELEKNYRKLESELAKAQRARKKARVKAIHAKIRNRRKDQLHKLSTALVEEYGAIFIGNVNASALAKTRMAKSVLDAGWSTFRTMLQYKSDDAGVWFDEVDEAFSTQTCSCCNTRTGPKGLDGLRIREWACSHCGAWHHRDINAATNILAAGRRRLAVGIPVL
ncbi:IS200/IS605 family element transposase accessory protein TnpB [Paraburkholderia sp. UCT31]|uniref:RNA-guided endonuclease InsQ/TnpB family protein n=1 Tax=Paraburkholderia sp. UCT31 TaxID=2615209 RepID=UPI00223A9EF6|nr:transposase [Paraburkholderia sp. UCT31]MBC8737161.1 IS200/IS605 family element transposase accessory protein TnpB [Paraburkholderia sp. UCT31]